MLTACALGVALLVPAIPLAAQEDDPPAAEAAPATTLTPGNVRPDAALTSAVQDGTVSFDASASADSDGTIAAYEWDLDGDSVFETDTGTDPRVQHEYPGGTTLVATVRVTDDAGASDDATEAVAVAASPEPAEATLVPTEDLAAAPAPAPASDAAESEPASAEPRATKRKRDRAKADDDAGEDAGDPPVNAAANGAVTITDFTFAPGTVNVKVGDSVTWLNRGPTVHTATASDGSFDSGNMARGKSYSKTFTSAGTFSYICTPHPFMKGKVVVTAAGSGSGGASGSGSGSGGSGSDSGDTAGATGSGGDSSGSGSLASTGADLVPWSLFGFSLLAFGAALRFRLTD